MKMTSALRIISIVLALILTVGSVSSQTANPHSATLTITPAADAVPGTTGYFVYRANAACPVSGLGGLNFLRLTSTAITTTTFTDSSVTVGTWCYYVTATLNNVESVPSTTAGGTAKPNTVTFSVTIQ